MRYDRGFTLVDALAVVGIVILLALILAPLLSTLTDTYDPPHWLCGTHLKGIGTGIEIYANMNDGRMPILPDIDESSEVDYAEALRLGSECTAAALGSGAQQNLCLLVQDGTLCWEMFLCPAVGERSAERPSASRRYGLGEVVNGEQKTYIDYALQIPYRRTPDGLNSCPLLEEMDASIAIMADRVPRSDFKTNWSPNHGKEGEFVLFADIHVEWFGRGGEAIAPNAVGYAGNNIYTADNWGGTPESPELLSNGTECKTPTAPQATKDSVLYHRW